MTTQQDVYNALQVAAHEICNRAFTNGIGVTVRRGKVIAFNPPSIALEIIEMLPQILTGEISVNDGMAFLHMPETTQARYMPRGNFKI